MSFKKFRSYVKIINKLRVKVENNPIFINHYVLQDNVKFFKILSRQAVIYPRHKSF